MRNRILLLSVGVMLGLLLFGCGLSARSISRITPTPTKTPRQLLTATLTSVASPTPTATPEPSSTPVPPTDTPTATEPPPPTDTLALPTDTPLPTEAPVTPTNTAPPPTATSKPPAPKPAATNTPVPPKNTPKPKAKDFVVKEIVAFEDGSLTKSGYHNVYLTVLDAGGAPLDGIVLEEFNSPPPTQLISGAKGPGKAEFTMYAGDYRFRVVGNSAGQAFTSEETHVLSVSFGHAQWDDLIRGGICADAASCEALGPIHFSYNVTFQRTP